MAEFFKPKTIGQALVGRISEFLPDKGNGPFIVLEPVILKEDPKGGYVRYHSLALGLSTDLRFKLREQNHKGQWVSVEFVDTEPTSKGSPKKIFKVMQLTNAEAADFSGMIERNAGDVYRKPVEQMRDEPVSSDDDDDLPF